MPETERRYESPFGRGGMTTTSSEEEEGAKTRRVPRNRITKHTRVITPREPFEKRAKCFGESVLFNKKMSDSLKSTKIEKNCLTMIRIDLFKVSEN